MKKLMVILAALLLHSFSYAANDSQLYFAPYHFQSKNGGDIVTINNGTNVPIFIQITVAGTETSPGVNITNCGNTTHVRPGSTVICFNIDGGNPVTFSADSAAGPATGTYQIRQRGW